MKKRVLLLAVSCKNGGLCPGGIDLDNPSEWIRIVRDDGESGAVQGYEIDFAEPLDVIEFEGRNMPDGIQVENWIIDNVSCRKVGRCKPTILPDVYRLYGYHGFWGNYKPYLTENEFDGLDVPSETIMRVTNIKIYKTSYGKAKIDFEWENALYPIKGVSMTDQDYYELIDEDDVYIDDAYIIVSIPKEVDDWVHPDTGEGRAYKFVSKIFEI